MNKPKALKIQFLRLLLACTLVPALLLSIAEADETDGDPRGPRSFFDLLLDQDPSQDKVIRFTLSFDHQQLEEMKHSANYFPATVSHAGENWDADLRIRGRYRRRVCDFPPLHLKLSKSMLRAAGLQQHNKFKLVTHCSDNFNARDNVLREQLSYELYHLITGQGFRTQLVEVTYLDTRTGNSFQRLGILIEDTDEMAAAHAGKECDNCTYLAAHRFVSGNPETVALFNYMIGNADWSAKHVRNVKVVQQQAGGKYLMIPYDFDFSGLVDVEYAKPNPNYDQVSIKDRIWIWEHDAAPTQLAEVIALYQSKETAIMNYVATFPGLEDRSRRQVSRYLERFFTEINEGSFPAGS